MAFPDFPFPSEWNSFLSHQQVLRYLQDYACHFDLYKFIQFNSSISSVRPLMGKDSQKPMWEVVVTDADTIKELQQVLLFDAVIVCNGWVSLLGISIIILFCCSKQYKMYQIIIFTFCYCYSCNLRLLGF